MNKTFSMGRLTDDPKVSETSTGKKIARFVMALDRTKDGADFPSFIAWEKSAELIEKSVHKGDRLLIEGHIQTGSYEKDGHKVYTTDIVVDRFEFIEPKKKDGTEGQPEDNHNDFMAIPEGLDEQMPFN